MLVYDLFSQPLQYYSKTTALVQFKHNYYNLIVKQVKTAELNLSCACFWEPASTGGNKVMADVRFQTYDPRVTG